MKSSLIQLDIQLEKFNDQVCINDKCVLRTPNIGYKLEFHDPVLCQLATEVNAKHQFFYLNEQAEFYVTF